MNKVVLVACLVLLLAASSLPAQSPSSSKKAAPKKPATTAKKALAKKASAKKAPARKASAKKAPARKAPAKKSSTKRRRGRRERFYTSSFAEDAISGDRIEGEDPVVRAASVEALGNMNGTVVAVDPNSGRILALVNRNLALSSGAQPCSTIKLAVALAALSEGLVTKDTPVKLGPQWQMNLVSAMAISNNNYFEELGRQMGFEKVSYYARLFGLGELAGENIDGEQLGIFPAQELDSRYGGVGKMCSFGESIYMTPLQLAALVSAIANGGTLYYLQHPRTGDEVASFTPQVKRRLDIARWIPDVTEGMAAVVHHGTARNVRYIFSQEEVLGKTGTCSKDGTRYGWFASYTSGERGRIVTVVFLQGGRPTYGPKAAEIAAHIYRSLYDRSYFAAAYQPPAGSAREATSDK
jgi:penicillin-binding protein 2